jgi:hypothetical protein
VGTNDGMERSSKVSCEFKVIVGANFNASFHCHFASLKRVGMVDDTAAAAMTIKWKLIFLFSLRTPALAVCVSASERHQRAALLSHRIYLFVSPA